MHAAVRERTKARQFRPVRLTRANAMPTCRNAVSVRMHAWHMTCLCLGSFLSCTRAKVMNLFAYPAFQAFADMMLPLRHSAALMNHSLDAWPALADTPHGRSIRASCELLTLAGLTPVR